VVDQGLRVAEVRYKGRNQHLLVSNLPPPALPLCVTFHSSTVPLTYPTTEPSSLLIPPQSLTMAAKKRCQFQLDTDSQCNSAALRIVGQCPHCRAQFCGAVSIPLPSPGECTPNNCPNSTVYRSTTAAQIWRTAGNRRLTGIRISWRVNGQWHPRWPPHSVLPCVPSSPLAGPPRVSLTLQLHSS
jgi:hypothetical protein